jgi:hypothetical protein
MRQNMVLVLATRRGDTLEHVPVLQDLSFIIETKDVYSCPVGVTRPFLAGMQDHVIAFGKSAQRNELACRDIATPCARNTR